MFNTLTLPELDDLVTAEQAKELEQQTTFTASQALRAAAGCHEVQQAFGNFGDGESTACALSGIVLVASRIGYLK